MNIYDKNHVHNAVYCQQLESLIAGEPAEVQGRANTYDSWWDVPNSENGLTKCDWHLHVQYRISPEMIHRIVSYPTPMKNAPMQDSQYWILDSRQDSGVAFMTWDGDIIDCRNLERGICFASEEDAVAAAVALFRV